MKIIPPNRFEHQPGFPGGLFAQLDRSRRELAKRLAAAGVGPIESPFRVVFKEPGLTLRHYGDGSPDGPALLMVPAPIKLSYIWDLTPRTSVVRQCLRRGLRVYLIHWEEPGKAEQHFGLAEYGDRLLLHCLEAVSRETGKPQVFLAAHSLGGTFAALFAALHPHRIKGLISLSAPFHFGRDGGVIDAMVTQSPKAEALSSLFGNVPGSFLSNLCFAADPITFGWSRWMDSLYSLSDMEAMDTHLRVEQWTLQEMPLAKRLFEEVVELLYREDRFMSGTLKIGGKPSAPELVRAPLLSVVDARCRIVPPQSVLPFHHAVPGTDKKILWYPGDTGPSLQHVGMLVGKRAHQSLWPEIIQWCYTQDR